MTKNERNVTRRGFIKGAAAVGVGVAAAGSAAGALMSSEGWLVPAHADDAGERTAYTYHQYHCGGMCPLACTVRDGRMMMVQPNHCCDDRYETICLKGVSEVQHIYGDHRIQTPLKRTGERGSGEFAPISWDEALDALCDTLKDIQREHGRDSVVVCSGEEANFPWLAATLGAQVDETAGIDVGIGNGLDPAIGFGGGYAMATCEARDWVNSAMVLNVGSNFLESSLPNARLFFEAQEAGTRMVTVDPHFSTTAGKSDEWVPITPGTDAALFLGMISVILDEKLYDEGFVLNHTSLPFLVDASTGLLVRDHAADPSAKEPETGEQNPFFVWDAVPSAKTAYTAAAKPVLEGSFTADGVSCATVFTLMKQQQAAYTPAWAEGVTSVPADTIAKLAREYAKGPACLALGWGGNDKMGNADIAGHAAALLAALTGNISKVGAGVGVFVGGIWNGYSGALGAWPLPEDMKPAESEMAIFDMRDNKTNVRAAIFCGDVIQQHIANLSKTEEWARSLDLIVTIDPYFTEGAKWADIILPACSRFENDAEVGSVKVGYNNIVLQNKVIDPLFEAKTDFWIGKEIAKRFGVDHHLPATPEEWVSTVLSTSKDPSIAALTIDKINDAQGVYPLAGIEEPRREFMDFAYATPSARLDVYYDNLASYGQALPVWEPPLEARADNELVKTYPLQLANVRTRYRIHNQFNDAKWIQQFAEPRIELNPSEMDSRNLVAGDAVEVFNDRGSFKCYVKANDSVRPGSARMFEGQTADYLIEGNLQSVTNDGYVKRGHELMCGPVVPFSDTLVEIKKA